MIHARQIGSLGVGSLLMVAGCAAGGGADATESACTIQQHSVPLPAGLAENSGVAIGQRAQDVLWIHNDSGDDPVVYAVSAAGALIGRVRVEGAKNRDWEDIATGPCPQGSCLYIGDIGDNAEDRRDVDVYRVSEPDPRSTTTAKADRFQLRYPDGARDAEALFVLPSEEIFIVTKGIDSPVEVYRYPPPLRPGRTVVLERVAALSPPARDEVLRVTGASASPSGDWVSVRTYGWLMLYRTEQFVAGNTEPALLVNLSPLGEAQGEAVALADDGTVILGSEGPSKRATGTLARLLCRLPA